MKKGTKVDRQVIVSIKGKFGEQGARIDCKILDGGVETDALSLAQMQFTALAMMDIANNMLTAVSNELVIQETDE